MLVVTAEQMRAIDRATIDDFGVPGPVLMEAAGRGAAEVILAARPAPGLRVAVLCGSGNNGGDGAVIARHLHNRGAEVRLYLCAPRDKIRGDADLHLRVVEKMGLPCLDARAGAAALDDFARHADVVVDALLGTGLSAEVRGVYRDIIEAVNGLAALVVAVDIPSGLDADRGVPLGVCVRADHTVTFAHPKLGLVTDPGFTRVGRLHVVDIGVPRGLGERLGAALWLLEEDEVRALRPARPPSGHKGTFGHLLIVAGSAGKTGAALLAGLAALRSGAGLATVASTAGGQRALDAKTLEVMTAQLCEGEEPDGGTWERFRETLHGKTAVALGPGIPRGPAMRGFVARLVAECPVPLVVDADGLNHLAEDPAPLRRALAPVVLTPHPGEMARLCRRATAEVQADRVGIARAFAAEHRAVVCLKGARTVVALPDGRAFLNPTGNPGMGTGGTGDVLCGMIGAFLAQGLDAARAARLAVFAHGRAGDLAAATRGEAGLIAGDLLDTLPQVLRAWEAADTMSPPAVRR
ncbi:MAG TPA: NAD(P)H-hydrate dehydratase [Polyangia bacterium]|jgi:NAD(P)H-hydrate epimerase